MAVKDITDRQVCEAYLDRPTHLLVDGPSWPEEILKERTGQSKKVCMRAMERACDRGLIDYGVSLRAGWLTDKGFAVLRGESEQAEGGNG